MITLNSDILLLIFSYLDLQSLLGAESICTNFKSIIRDPELFADQLLFSHHLKHYLINNFSFSGTNSATATAIVETFMQSSLILDGGGGPENCRQLMKEYIWKPFESITTLSNDSYKSYCEKGGVIDITLLTPCSLLKKLLKHFNQEKDATTSSRSVEHFRCTLHKFILILHLAFIQEDQQSTLDRVCLIRSKNQVVFNMDQRNAAHNNGKNLSKSVKLGKAFIVMLNDFKDVLAQQNKSAKHISLSFNNNQVVISFTEALQKAKPEEGWNNIFQDCSSPPYKMKNASKEVKEMIEQLYGSGECCDHYCWNDYLYDGDETWAQYWLMGMEWWGTHALTSYNFESEQFIVATASTTD